MAKIKVKNIENVEGKYHLMFLEGKNMMENAKNDMLFSLFAMLLFSVCIAIFTLVSGFNIFYIAFLAVFLIFFLVMVVHLIIVKHKGKKQCVMAVENSKQSDIVAKHIDDRSTGKAFVKSMSSTIDKYDEKKKFPGLVKKIVRKRKHDHLVDVITEFEKEEKKDV